MDQHAKAAKKTARTQKSRVEAWKRGSCKRARLLLKSQSWRASPQMHLKISILLLELQHDTGLVWMAQRLKHTVIWGVDYEGLVHFINFLVSLFLSLFPLPPWLPCLFASLPTFFSSSLSCLLVCYFLPILLPLFLPSYLPFCFPSFFLSFLPLSLPSAPVVSSFLDARSFWSSKSLFWDAAVPPT